MPQCPPERVVARPQDDAEHPVLPRPQRASFDMTAFCRARTCPCIEVTPSGPGGNLLQSDASVASKSGRLRLPVARLVDNRRIGLASGCCLRLLPPLISHRPDYAEGVARSLLQHIHNPLLAYPFNRSSAGRRLARVVRPAGAPGSAGSHECSVAPRSANRCGTMPGVHPWTPDSALRHEDQPAQRLLRLNGQARICLCRVPGYAAYGSGGLARQGCSRLMVGIMRVAIG